MISKKNTAKIKTIITAIFLALIFVIPTQADHHLKSLTITLETKQGPITEEQSIRFSLWSASLIQKTDISGGVINTSATDYRDYQIEIIQTPDSNGEITIDIVNLPALPTINEDNQYLMIEYKGSGEPIAQYKEYISLFMDSIDIDRYPLYKLPQDPNDIFYSTPSEVIVLDSDDSVSANESIQLQFGGTLEEAISWDMFKDSFTISDDLYVENDLGIGGINFVLDADNEGPGNTVGITANQGSDNDGTLRYNSESNQWEISNDGGAFAAIATGTSIPGLTLPAVQARSTAVYTLTTTPTDIAFNLTDIESDSTAIEHNNTNTDRINVYEDGLYLITYDATGGGSATSTHETYAQVKVNDTSILPSSYTVNGNYQTEYSSNSATFLANLNANDFVSLELWRNDTVDETQGDISFSVTKLEGIKGEKGDTGEAGAGGGQSGWLGYESRIMITPMDFQSDDRDDNMDIDQGGKYIFETGTASPVGTFAIPNGFTATNVMIYGSDTANTVSVNSNKISDGTTQVQIGNGTVGEEINITDVNSAGDVYVSVYINVGASDQIHGGYITITPTP